MALFVEIQCFVIVLLCSANVKIVISGNLIMIMAVM